MPAAHTLEELIAILEARQGLLADQLASLRMPVANTCHALLLQYVLLGSGDAAAKWAAAQGWRLPSATGTRAYVAADVTALIDASPEPVPAGLISLARERFAPNAKAVNRRYG